MNGQNNMPKWMGDAIKIGGIVIAGVVAFTWLQADVRATDLMASDNKIEIEKHEERLDSMQISQVEQMAVLNYMKETLDEIKDDLKDHND